jgi:tight adherence protein C
VNLSLVLLSGVLLASGVVALVVAVMPATPRLPEALDRVSGDSRASDLQSVDIGSAATRSDRLGASLYRLSPIPVTARQRQRLKLQHKSIAEFYSDKAVMAAVGAVIPALLAFTATWFSGSITPYPAIAGLAGAVLGFFAPDLLLLRSAETARSGAVEALLVYIDLVTLERLANASATQALHNAAKLSEVAIFVQIRTALERAQLEQQSPYGELRRLADELDLPELTDVSDVMQLDETGAALSGALRARVRELRDAHLMQEQMRASADAEGMTLYMTLPALIFGLFFMVPPLMKIVLG